MRYTLDSQYEKMPWQDIDAVVFDVGNVLLTFNPQQIMEEYVPNNPELYSTLLRKVFHSPYWVMIDHGSADYEEIVNAMIGNDVYLEDAVRTIMKHWPEMKHPIEEGIRTVEACKAHDKKLIVMSNYGDHVFAMVHEKYPFFKLFDGFVISSRVDVIKPDHSIYDLAVSRYDLTPERTLFIDDSPANIEGALHAGWQGICYQEPGMLDAFFTD